MPVSYRPTYSTGSTVVLGAQQVILVRDAKAAEKLDAQLKGLCNVIPIMDSKGWIYLSLVRLGSYHCSHIGLEFDDVLIYDFFSTSPAGDAWELLSGSAMRGIQGPPPILCSELKLLYVAVTRARRRCWIWDSYVNRPLRVRMKYNRYIY